MGTDPAYLEALHQEAQEYADNHPGMSEEDARTAILKRAGIIR